MLFYPQPFGYVTSKYATIRVVELPNLGDDDFDKDITNPFAEMPEPMPMVFMFMEMRESFLAMVAASFTDAEALRFHAYCALFDGEV